ncbi:hypothetical protein OSB04_026444 [Centaurea solstitialis]|uniref:Dolichyl-diphosphooligosaccharide--protein glycosyltransferase subunit 4 n=1 Tax=Centaurea solstitialis TaxID=347529 RepID=A0AA38SCP9_9ASTR|nr:hypothetical protein OSB04_026444 [Centaurea solstitialis]
MDVGEIMWCRHRGLYPKICKTTTKRASSPEMITDDDLGFIANFLGIFIFALVIAYHYVLADPKYFINCRIFYINFIQIKHGRFTWNKEAANK